MLSHITERHSPYGVSPPREGYGENRARTAATGCDRVSERQAATTDLQAIERHGHPHHQVILGNVTTSLARRVFRSQPIAAHRALSRARPLEVSRSPRKCLFPAGAGARRSEHWGSLG